MHFSSSLPESQQRLPNHDHQQFHDQSTQSYYYHQQPRHVSYTPPDYAYHQVTHQRNPEPPGVSVNTIQQQIVDSVWRMALVGLNPVAAAAVVAMSQLVQFQGTSTAGMQPNFGMLPLPHHGPTLMPPPPASGSPYNSDGRRGSRSYRGHGRGYNGQRLPKTGDRGTRSGGGRGPQCFQQHRASSASQQEPRNDNVKSMDEAELLAVIPKKTAQTAVHYEASQPIPTVEKACSSRRPPQGARCELCRVECTSLEILEQHKYGKRHKRNLQKTEESKIAVKPGIEKHHAEKPTAKPENEGSEQPNSAEESKEKKPIESVGGENSMEPKQQINREKYVAASVEETPMIGCFDSQRHGMKRKMQGGRGGECMKSLEAPSPEVGPCKRKVVIPFICDMCNVKCDSQEAFDCHLSGKKHTAKLKQFGPVGLQVLYPPNPIAKTILLPQGNQQPVHGSPGSHPAAEA
ncbi:hypothetical protein REPUB_Repub07fG0217700 [Reevesia pubescens]